MKRILLSGSRIFYEIYNIKPRGLLCAELFFAELSVPNCPRRIVLRRIVRAGLSGNPESWAVHAGRFMTDL